MFGNILLILHRQIDNHMRNNLKVVYLEGALNFIESLPISAGDKLLEVVHRIESGERNAQLFKKLDGSEIWEFRALYNRIAYRLFAFGTLMRKRW